MNKKKKFRRIKISYSFNHDLDNKYFDFLNNNTILDLTQIRNDFILFMKTTFPTIIVTQNLSHLSICSDKIKKYQDSKELEKDIKEISKYLKAYNSIIKGANKYTMEYMSAKCYIELANQRKEHKQEIDKLNKIIKILCNKLDIDPDNL